MVVKNSSSDEISNKIEFLKESKEEVNEDKKEKIKEIKDESKDEVKSEGRDETNIQTQGIKDEIKGEGRDNGNIQTQEIKDESKVKEETNDEIEVKGNETQSGENYFKENEIQIKEASEIQKEKTSLPQEIQLQEEVQKDENSSELEILKLQKMQENKTDKIFDYKNENSIVVKNFDSLLKKEDLIKYFSSCGEIKNISISKNYKNRSKGMAYIEFSKRESVSIALSLNNSVFKGKRINVLAKKVLNKRNARRI